ncbi:alpha/beta fold hydrolase [Corynebacterium sp. P7003]|uniref:Alpha/beta fold hydrolase n=1 Tax=Corynebacterium pygosceleis TaxID=2800406 RepID=A0ABT3WSB1_9CORY|nr:lipase family protein [Corynebacterium pygosceleis]MCX7444204.1 alpha/beta fold hydrolase [Corynebacterium pygosceleis]
MPAIKPRLPLMAVLAGTVLAVAATVTPATAAAPDPSPGPGQDSVLWSGPLPGHGVPGPEHPTRVFTDGTPLDISDDTIFTYSTLTSDNTPVPSTALLMRSHRPWTGTGGRPLAVIAPVTQGMDDACAFSRVVRTGAIFDPVHPELSATAPDYFRAHLLLDRGIDVVVTDYPGLGSPGIHPYMDNVATGRATADAGVAALALLGRPDAPVVATGHSQGGAATGWVAENAHGYTPQLNLRAVAVSSPPHNFRRLTVDADGSLAMGLMLMATDTQMRQSPSIRAEMERILTDEGRRMIADMRRTCTPGVFLPTAFRRSSSLTTTGESLVDVIDRMPGIQAEFRRQELGTRAPEVPVLLTYHMSDPLVNGADSRALGESWREHGDGRGVTVIEAPDSPVARSLMTGHPDPAVTHVPMIVDWLVGQLDG